MRNEERPSLPAQAPNPSAEMRSSGAGSRPWGAGERSGILVFRGRGDAQALCLPLIQEGFVVRVRSGGFRVAPRFYNHEDDIDRLLGALDRLAAG